MMKKLMLCLVLLSGIYGCCNDTPLYWGFNEVSIDLLDTNGELITSANHDEDKLYLDIFPTSTLLSQQSFMLGGTSLYAFSYPEEGENGLKDKISKIEISCNEVYGEISAGELLNDELSFLFLSPDHILNTEDLINEMNRVPYHEAISYSEFFLKLRLNNKPADDLEREFTVKFTFDSNRVLTETSSAINWK